MTNVGVLGGTGAMGSRLALQLSKNNVVRIGSRSAERATAAAAKIPGVQGGSDQGVATWCEVAIVSVPFDAIKSLKKFAEPLSDKLVISPINPLEREGRIVQYALKSRSAAELVASALPRSRVATAFNNLPATFFRGPSRQEADTLIAADSRETYKETATLIRSIPRLRPLYIGPLSQAQSVERLTVMVLNAAALNGGPELSVRFVSQER